MVTNSSAPLRVTRAFVPMLAQNAPAAVVNVPARLAPD